MLDEGGVNSGLNTGLLESTDWQGIYDPNGLLSRAKVEYHMGLGSVTKPNKNPTRGQSSSSSTTTAALDGKKDALSVCLKRIVAED